MSAHPGVPLLVDAVAKLGFRERSELLFTRDFASYEGWLGFNTATRRGTTGEMLIHPIVGVRYGDVEEWVARVGNKKLRPYSPPTFSEPLRYLVPIENRQDWVLNGGPSDSSAVADFSWALDAHGLRFMEDMGDLRLVAAKLGKNAANDQNAAYRWPVALLLTGQTDDALRAVRTVRSTLEGRGDDAAEELRKYLMRLEADIRSQF